MRLRHCSAEDIPSWPVAAKKRSLYVLQMVKLFVADRSDEDAALALEMLDAEIEEFL